MTSTETFALLLLLLGMAVPLALIARLARIPPAASFVIGGMIIAVTPGVPVVTVPSELILALFLPPLLQASAFVTVWRDFRANLRPILLLAIGAVAFSTFAVGWVLRLLVPDLSWAACIAFGAIVSPPDAVSASAVLEQLRIPRRLVTVIEGESLINDASGLVLYRFAVTAALTGGFDALSALGTFLLVAGGGIALGYACGRGFVWASPRLRDSRLEITASFLVSWTSYLAAEAVGCSGVLASVTCGLVMGWWRHEVFDSQTRLEARATWSTIVFMLEALVFILIGSSLHGVLARVSYAGVVSALPTAGLVAAAVIAARFIWVFPAAYLPRAILPSLRRNDPYPSWTRPFIVSWAGMRGVVSLAAALALPVEFPGRDLILFLTFAVILVTVLVQGSTLGPLIHWLGVSKPAEGDGTRPDGAARTAVAEAMAQALEAMATDPLEGPIARDLFVEYRDRAGNAGRWQQAGAAGVAELGARRSLRLQAIAAGRKALLELLRDPSVHDSVIDLLERELDLEELRYRLDYQPQEL